MGVILSAFCTACGYKKENLFFGSGMRSSSPRLLASDPQTNEIILTGPDNKNCDFYHDPKMFKGENKDGFIQDFDVFLSPENNQCPRCKKYTLSFEPIGQWD
ncbi:MAG: hypothetical protein KBA14_05235 [Saprospiraceae bacterium]|nr:hypothetical protein [Saprospiraceae bacterium]